MSQVKARTSSFRMPPPPFRKLASSEHSRNGVHIRSDRSLAENILSIYSNGFVFVNASIAVNSVRIS